MVIASVLLLTWGRAAAPLSLKRLLSSNIGVLSPSRVVATPPPPSYSSIARRGGGGINRGETKSMNIQQAVACSECKRRPLSV